MNRAQYASEFQLLKTKRAMTKEIEDVQKSKVKQLESELKVLKRDLRDNIEYRRMLDRRIKGFWAEKSRKESQNRQWAKKNPGKALDTIIHT